MRLNSVSVSGSTKNAPRQRLLVPGDEVARAAGQRDHSLSGGRAGPGGFSGYPIPGQPRSTPAGAPKM